MSTVNPYKKRRELVVIGVETTRGTAATKKHAVMWLGKNMKSVPNILENESAVGLDTKINDSAIDVWHSEGPLSGKVTEEGLGYLLNGMFNKVTTVDNEDGTYTHTFERDPSVARKTLSLWDVRPGLAGVRLFKSLYMDNLNLNIEVGDSGAWLESSTAFKGWKHEDVGSFSPPAFSTGEKEFTSRMVELRIADDVAGLTAGKIKPRSIELALEESVTVDHYVGEVDNDPEFDSAPAEAKGSMVVKYRSTDFEDDYFDNKIHAMSFSATNGDEKVEFIGTKVRFREVTDSDGRDDVVSQTISFYFESDFNNGGKDIIAKVTNKLASFTS